ncbi:uncharacterized protein LOC108109655 [Drosophila eugracilis]|uniref:uncharacterized protein LOC108109655 n=1 Tax=Drosophila eugracilis TaxID=29029 RepID=UPI0007E855AE|nr:uncharacterized protein LOC108109655 [Drosophila eugracilis]
MFHRGLKKLRFRPLARSVSFLIRSFSGNSRRKPKFVRYLPIASKSNLFNWPTPQRYPLERPVFEKDDKPYSEFHIENTRIHEKWQQNRCGANEQHSLRSHQPASSEVSLNSYEAVSAIEKVRQSEERRKIQNRLRYLMEEQQKLDERIQDEQDRMVRAPAQRDVPREYAPNRHPEISKPGSWASATVLAVTGKMQHHRYIKQPAWMYTDAVQKIQNEAQPESTSRPDSASDGSDQPKTGIHDWAKSTLELQKSEAKKMENLRWQKKYCNKSACLKLCDLSSLFKIRNY